MFRVLDTVRSGKLVSLNTEPKLDKLRSHQEGLGLHNRSLKDTWRGKYDWLDSKTTYSDQLDHLLN